MFLLLYPNKIITRLVPHKKRFAIIYDIENGSGPEIIYQPTIVVIANNTTPNATNPLVLVLFFVNSIGLTPSFLDKSENLSYLIMILLCNESI